MTITKEKVTVICVKVVDENYIWQDRLEYTNDEYSNITEQDIDNEIQNRYNTWKQFMLESINGN